jgi:hypothetical protein
VSKNSTRRQVRRALAEHAATKRREAVIAAAGRARLRGLTRRREPETPAAEEELVLRGGDGNLRALLATAPTPAPAPAGDAAPAGCADGCPGDHGDDAAGNCPGCDDTCPACDDTCPGCTDACSPPAAEASGRGTAFAETTAVPELPPPAERTPADQALDPPANGVPFTIPVAVLEGYETPDGRFLTAGNGGRRDLPMTLMAMLQNPDGGWGHDAAIAVGRVDTLERFDASAVTNPLTGEPYGPGVWGWKATGYLTPNADQEGSSAAVDFIRDQVIRGVSVDLDEFTAHEEILEMDEEGWPTKWRLIVDEWSIGQMTVCPFAAFPGATIVLDGEAVIEPGSEPAEGAVPAATVASAGQPGVLTFRGSGCVTCETAALTASAAPGVIDEGIAPVYPPSAWFSRQPQHDKPMTRHVYVGRNADGSLTGQVWGRIAWWDVCHSGVGDSCVVAPRLGESGYAGFHTRGSVYTAEGEELGVGLLTHGGGHANIHLGVTPALAHYDTAGAAYCKVRVGEDEDGIWFAGTFRPQITREQIEDFAAFPVSGDWRADAGDRDVRFIAAVSVNTPGFSPPRMALAASGARALIAAGARATAARAARGGTDAAAVEAAIARALRPVLASAARTRLRDLTRPRPSRT